jgi:hypothetical protein
MCTLLAATAAAATVKVRLRRRRAVLMRVLVGKRGGVATLILVLLMLV